MYCHKNRTGACTGTNNTNNTTCSTNNTYNTCSTNNTNSTTCDRPWKAAGCGQTVLRHGGFSPSCRRGPELSRV